MKLDFSLIMKEEELTKVKEISQKKVQGTFQQVSL